MSLNVETFIDGKTIEIAEKCMEGKSPAAISEFAAKIDTEVQSLFDNAIASTNNNSSVTGNLLYSNLELSDKDLNNFNTFTIGRIREILKDDFYRRGGYESDDLRRLAKLQKELYGSREERERARKEREAEEERNRQRSRFSPVFAFSLVQLAAMADSMMNNYDSMVNGTTSTLITQKLVLAGAVVGVALVNGVSFMTTGFTGLITPTVSQSNNSGDIMENGI